MYNNGRSYLCRFKVKANTHLLRVASSHGCSMMEIQCIFRFPCRLQIFQCADHLGLAVLAL